MSPRSGSKGGDTSQGEIQQRSSIAPKAPLAEEYQPQNRRKTFRFQRIAWSRELTEEERRQEEVVFNLFGRRKPISQSEPPRRLEPPRRRELPRQNELPHKSEIPQRPTLFGTTALRPLLIRGQTEARYCQQMPRGTVEGHFDPPRPSRPFTGPPGRPANRNSDSTFAGCSFGNFMATSVYETPPPLPESYNRAYQPGDEVTWSQQANIRSRNRGDRKAGLEDDGRNRGYEQDQFTGRLQHHAPVQAQIQSRLQTRSRLLPGGRSQAQIQPRGSVSAAPAITSREWTQNLHFSAGTTGNLEYHGDDGYPWCERERLHRPIASHSNHPYYQSQVSRPTPSAGRYDRVGDTIHDHEHFSDPFLPRSPRSYHFQALSSLVASTSRPASPIPVALPAICGRKRTYDRQSITARDEDAGAEESRRKKSRGNSPPPADKDENNDGDKNDEKEGDEKIEGSE